MISRLLALGLFGCLLFGQSVQPFRSEVNLVDITAVARTSEGKLLMDLKKEDFEVLEDGIPQTIQFFARDTDLPLSLGLIIDFSGSQDPFIAKHNDNLLSFLKAVLRPSDQVFAVGFGNHLRLLSDRPGNIEELADAVKLYGKSHGSFPEIGPKEERDLGTALYDAVYFSIQDKLRSLGERRRALILFTDGEENSSEHDLLDAIEAAQDSDTLIYGLRYTHAKHGKETARNRYGMRVMNHLAMLTGGLAFDAREGDLTGLFAQIGDELRSTYRIAYASTNGAHDSSFRKVSVRCRRPGVTIRSKSGYYAKP